MSTWMRREFPGDPEGSRQFERELLKRPGFIGVVEMHSDTFNGKYWVRWTDVWDGSAPEEGIEAFIPPEVRQEVGYRLALSIDAKIMGQEVAE